jgi:hypothetical protein
MRASILTFGAAPIALAAGAQSPAQQLYVHNSKVRNAELRWVDFNWRPDIFEAIEKGGNLPDAKRNWILARLITEERFTFEGKSLRQGNYGLVLWPRDKDQPLTLEIREVDMREVLQPNVLAEAPKGTTMHRAPANFETLATEPTRLDGGLTDVPDGVQLELRYGNRRLLRKLIREAK